LAGFKRLPYLAPIMSTGKHFVNNPATLVQDSLRGLELINPDIKVDVKHKGVLPNSRLE